MPRHSGRCGWKPCGPPPPPLAGPGGRKGGKPLSWFGETLGRASVSPNQNGAGRLLGMLTYHRDEMLTRRHIGHLWGMHVRADARGLGLGAAMLDACIGHARGQVSVLQIMVGEANAAARLLYERAGFVTYGTELASLQVDGVDATTLLMAMRLD